MTDPNANMHATCLKIFAGQQSIAIQLSIFIEWYTFFSFFYIAFYSLLFLYCRPLSQNCNCIETVINFWKTSPLLCQVTNITNQSQNCWIIVTTITSSTIPTPKSAQSQVFFNEIDTSYLQLINTRPSAVVNKTHQNALDFLSKSPLCEKISIDVLTDFLDHTRPFLLMPGKRKKKLKNLYIPKFQTTPKQTLYQTIIDNSEARIDIY